MQPAQGQGSGRVLATVNPGRNPGLVERFRQRLFPGASLSLPQTPDKLKAGIAELLLVNRLRARSTRKAQATEMLERASQIVFVTCKNWFSPANSKTPERRTPL